MSLRIRAIISITTCRVCMSLSLLHFPSTPASVTSFQVPRHSRTLSCLSSLTRMVFLQISTCFNAFTALSLFSRITSYKGSDPHLSLQHTVPSPHTAPSNLLYFIPYHLIFPNILYPLLVSYFFPYVSCPLLYVSRDLYFVR